MLGEPRPRRLKKSKASGFNIRGNQLFLGGPQTAHRIDIWIGFLFDFCWLRGSVVVLACLGLYLSCLFVFGIYRVKPSKSRTVLCAARGNVLLCSGCWLRHMGALWWWISCGFRKIGVWLPASVRWVMWSWTMYVKERIYMEKRMQGTLCSVDEFNKGNWLLRGFSRRGICFTVAWYGHCRIVGLLRADGIFEGNNYGVQRQSNYASILTCFTRSFWANDLFYYSILVKLHFWVLHIRYTTILYTQLLESRDSGNLSSVHF